MIVAAAACGFMTITALIGHWNILTTLLFAAATVPLLAGGLGRLWSRAHLPAGYLQ